MTEARSRPTRPPGGPGVADAAARLAAIVDSSEDVIVSKTLDGIITSWNPAAERLLGWTAAEAVGRSITLIIPEEWRAEEDTVLARVRHGERVDDEDAESHEHPLQRRGSGRGGLAAFSGSSIVARPTTGARPHPVPIMAPMRDGLGSQERCQVSHGGVTRHCRDYMPASSAVKR